MMTADDVLDLYRSFADAGIEIWIDGGWAVDALLGEETRPHSDLDIALQKKDVPKMREVLESRGYKDVPREHTWEWNFVLGDEQGRQIDVHVFVFDEHRNVIEGIQYPTKSLTGEGTIKGEKVKCIAPEYMVKFLAEWVHKHPQKYMPAIKALCDKFGIEYPEEYKKIT